MLMDDDPSVSPMNVDIFIFLLFNNRIYDNNEATVIRTSIVQRNAKLR